MRVYHIESIALCGEAIVKLEKKGFRGRVG